MNDTVEAEVAHAVWAYGDNDDVWELLFNAPMSTFAPQHIDIDYTEVASELLDRIERDPEWVVGDLTHEQVIAAIHRRYPILGPNPGF